jgi:ribosomal protein S18 acetylase RimI-like enzyme
MNDLAITVESQPKTEDRRKIFEELHRHNAARSMKSELQSLSIFLRDAAGNVVGGLLGETFWGWLYVEFMWIEESLRGQDYGKKLLAAAESEAIARGCGNALLDTFSFQAFEFYRRCGYEVFGELEDFPPPHKRFYMKKSLEANSDGETDRR